MRVRLLHLVFAALLAIHSPACLPSGDDDGGGSGGSAASTEQACRDHCSRSRALCTGLDQDWEDACIVNCQEYNLVGRGCAACVERAATCDEASNCSC